MSISGIIGRLLIFAAVYTVLKTFPVLIAPLFIVFGVLIVIWLAVVVLPAFNERGA